ncbi:MAG TPA: hypothetical protein PL009_05385 [Flavipsychrobacter sp.]|nr:hypothetical protein [Flavipsychrobacter sp.]
MRYLLTILLCTVTFFACKKKDNGFPHQGQWEGTYSGVDNGTWKGDISSEGIFTGTASSSLAPTFSFNVTGTVTDAGAISASFNLLSYSVNFTGQISSNTVSGTWVADSVGIGGIWTGQRK